MQWQVMALGSGILWSSFLGSSNLEGFWLDILLIELWPSMIDFQKFSEHQLVPPLYVHISFYDESLFLACESWHVCNERVVSDCNWWGRAAILVYRAIWPPVDKRLVHIVVVSRVNFCFLWNAEIQRWLYFKQPLIMLCLLLLMVNEN